MVAQMCTPLHVLLLYVVGRAILKKELSTATRPASRRTVKGVAPQILISAITAGHAGSQWPLRSSMEASFSILVKG